jgi:hypothetical protein
MIEPLRGSEKAFFPSPDSQGEITILPLRGIRISHFRDGDSQTIHYYRDGILDK